MSKKGKILVIRFSALGDVAMTVPVIWSFKEEYPEHEIIFVSRPFAQKLYGAIDGVKFIAADFNKTHKGLGGLINLYKKLRSMGPYLFVADLHGVIRSRFIGLLFRIAGVKIIEISKGRKEKKALTRIKNKQLAEIPSTFERYRDVFKRGGLDFNLRPFPGKEIYSKINSDVPHDALLLKGNLIGIAPFTKHQWKTWPEKRMVTLLKILDGKGFQIFLFGGKGEEQDKLEEWSTELLNVHNLAGQLNIQDELRAMSYLDVMVSMDSANMHLASLVGTPVVSIWGATHPFAGFYGWYQEYKNAVQVDLECRPCSVYGNKTCHRGDFACMEYITVEMVLERIQSVLVPN